MILNYKYLYRRNSMNKKNVTSVALLILIVFLMLGLTACEKLKISNLTANHYLRAGNGFYQEEKFKKAVDAYEKALELNPKLNKIYFHVATSYAALYKPSKDTELNKMYGEKALEYLLKAKEQEPENTQIYHVLGDIYEKMGKIDEAEECYLTIKDRSGDNPNSYYVLANFYMNHNKPKKAEDMYKKRIEMDVTNPEGYHYLAGYYQDLRNWYKAVEAHEMRISALIDPKIVTIQHEVFKLQESVEKIQSKKKYLANVQKNKAIPAEQKAEIATRIQQELAEIGTEEELAKQIEAKQLEVDAAKKEADEKVKTFPEEKRWKIADAYYNLGLVLWNQSHQTSPEFMGPKERLEIIAKGMDVLHRALELKENYYEPWAIIALLHRQKIKAEPLKEKIHMAAWKEAYDKAIKIMKRNARRAKLQKELSEMGTEGN